jgi:hypothetical protein
MRRARWRARSLARGWALGRTCGLVLASAFVAQTAAAIDVEKLVMPGPVIEGHADVEGECGKCHAPFRQEEQEALCLACHEEVGADLKRHAGFHGRAPEVARARCSDCHTEHEGRDADVVGLDRAAFDHGQTDYPLEGAHARVSCEGCHRKGVAFRDAPGECFSCHRGDDPHAGELGEDCGRCHEVKGWGSARFDHDRTEFPLVGAHRDVACGLCHPGERYEGTATACNGCHRLDDAHRGRYGPGCDRCHGAEAWKPASFDHARDARFALHGRHARLACAECHTGSSLEAEVATACAGCHRADDVHRGRRGEDCEHCHGESTWKVEAFDHDGSTRFPLRGAHERVRCEGCHTGTLGHEDLATQCVGCHADDDVHEGQQDAKCERCHSERGWTEKVFFEHDVTKFPLLGLHATVACEQCHATRRFHDAAASCDACHRDDDVHLGRLGGDCARCHNPNGWQLWRFDHGQETEFPLTGAHAKLACDQCHRSPAGSGATTPSTCGGCHAKDDPHAGSFGRSCERCHNDASWSDVEIRR